MTRNSSRRIASQVETCFSSHCNLLLCQTQHLTPPSRSTIIVPSAKTTSTLLPLRPQPPLDLGRDLPSHSCLRAGVAHYGKSRGTPC